jgi:ribosomal-protein-alanine acetyltransferase
VNLRPATAADVPVIAALEEVLFGVDAWSAASVTSDLDTPGRRVVVVEDGGIVVGYAVSMLGGDLVDLQRIGVDPDRQGRGVARALLGHLLDAAGLDGAEAMLLEVSTHNHAALRLYTRAGFTEIDRRSGYYRDGSDAVVMRRLVPTATQDRRG